ncbi:MAG: ATP-binding protein [Gordonia sp. (in: high G+C Gram-positive bacteria)]|uniref:sensor histidine kinase n=1 Tax=Gordonia sp. (in: high G+C Gram-positive bacteria) TaxID=84139 RepID=UPI0039E6DA21
MFARFTAVGYVAYFLILFPEFVAVSSMMASWWTPVTVITIFAPGMLLGVASSLRSTASIPVVGALSAATFMVGVVTWYPAWDGTSVAVDGRGVWLAAFPGLPAIAAVLAWPAWAAFAYMAVACIGCQWINYLVRGGVEPEMLVPEMLFAIMFCSLFVGGSVMALRTGRILDASTEEAHETAASAAAQQARAVERERFDGLTHDSVMSTLIIASRVESTEAVQPLAAATLAELDEIHVGGASDRPFSLHQALGHLRSAAAEADPGAVFDVADESAGTFEEPGRGIPAEVVRALSAAQAEALRNCVRHAGDEALREVLVLAHPDGLRVQVTDDGVGFDPATVPPQRLGLTVSIRRRMARIPGGSAQIDSALGVGTTVGLEWIRI